MSDRLRTRGHALAACAYLALSFLFALDRQIFPSVLFGVAAIGAFDAAMYVYEVRTGDRPDPRVAELTEALAKVRPDAEAAVNRSAKLAGEYLDRAHTAERAVERVRDFIERHPDYIAVEPSLVLSALDAHPKAVGWCPPGCGGSCSLSPEPPPCTCTFGARCAQCPPEDDDQEQGDPGPECPDEPGEEAVEVEHQALALRRQPGYDAVYTYIRTLPAERSSLENVVRNAQIWRAVEAALDALNVGRCISSHCVENDHVVPAAASEALLHYRGEPTAGDRVRVIYEATYEKHDMELHWVKAGDDPNNTWINIVPANGTVTVVEPDGAAS